MPIDFLAEDNFPSAQVAQRTPMDFLQEDNIPQPAEVPESIGTAVLYGMPRVATDLASGIYQLGMNVPKYLQQAKTEVPGIYSAFKNDPKHALSQVGAGLAELGQNAFNYPHDLVNYLSKRLHLVPEDINAMVQMGRMPEDTGQMINQTFGTPKAPGEALLRGTMRNLPMAIGGAQVLQKLGRQSFSTLKNSLNKVDPRAVAESIQRSHDILDQSASNVFKNVGNEVSKRNIGQVPIRKDLISDIAGYLPKTEGYKNLLDKAFTGDYEGLRQLQSDLWHEANNYSRSPLASERNVGKEIMSLRNEINDSMIKHFKNTGNQDLANQLLEAKKTYSNLKKTYYGKKTPAAIKNLVHPESRKMPKNIMNVLSEESKPMARIKEANPFAAKQSTKYLNKQNALNTLSHLVNVLKSGSLIGAGLVGAPILYNKYFNQPKQNE